MGMGFINAWPCIAAKRYTNICKPCISIVGLVCNIMYLEYILQRFRMRVAAEFLRN